MTNARRTTYNARLVPSEAAIQRAIMDYLEARHYYVIRLNSGTTVIEQPTRRVLRSQPAGTPDLLAFRSSARHLLGEADVLFIEVKRPGKRPTDAQVRKMAELRAYGARCIVATSVEDVQLALEGMP